MSHLIDTTNISKDGQRLCREKRFKGESMKDFIVYFIISTFINTILRSVGIDYTTDLFWIIWGVIGLILLTITLVKELILGNIKLPLRETVAVLFGSIIFIVLIYIMPSVTDSATNIMEKSVNKSMKAVEQLHQQIHSENTEE